MYIYAPFGFTFIGLFGRTDGAILTDIEIVSSRIAGHCVETELSGCVNTGELRADRYAGGVTGCSAPRTR